MPPERGQDPQPPAMEAAAEEITRGNPRESSDAILAQFLGAGGAAAAAAPARERETPPVEPALPMNSTTKEDTTASAQPAATAEPAEQTEMAESTEAAEKAEHSEVTQPEAAQPEATEPEATEPSETAETMDQLLDQFATPETGAGEGEIFDGHVLAVTEAGVIVDVGGKFEGLVPAQEFLDSGGAISSSARGKRSRSSGCTSERTATSCSRTCGRTGGACGSASRSRTASTANVTGKITERIKGGLVVDIGVRAFLPASQIELRPVHDLEAWKDREIEVRVLKLNRKRGNVVVSRRAILEEEQKAKRDALAATLSEGAVVTGRVKNVTDYGVFVDLGGMDGLLHVSDLVWGRVPHPSTVVKPGDEIQVQILKFDKDKQRISLGRKQLLPDPWATVPERFPAGTRVHGKVVGVTDYGAFVQIEPGVEGLVHVSEMSWSKRAKHPSKIVKVGDEVEVVVLEVKTDQRRISLGLKQTLPDPWEAAAEKYPVGAIVTGRIRNLADFGAFVEIEEGMEGLIHISDVSWTERSQASERKIQEGRYGRGAGAESGFAEPAALAGIKQVNDIWANWFAEHKMGDMMKGKVTRTTDFGAFVELAESIEGLCHVSEIEERRPKGEREKEKASRGERVASVLAPGQEYDFKILRLEPEQHKISLSYRAAQKQAERQEIETFRSSKSSPNATIGDAILAKRQLS